MMLKKFRCLALVMALILVFVSCTTFAAKKKPIKLVYGTVYTVDSFLSKGDRYFKELVEKNSKGRILVDFFPASQLGSAKELLEGTRSGAQQMTIVSPGDCATIIPKLGTFDLPYLFRDDTHLSKVAKKITSIIDQNELATKIGFHILNVRTRAPRHLTTKFSVNKVEDIKGLKVRVPENPLFIAFVKAWGAIPTTIPAPDTYTALATGTVDAQENPLADIYMWKTYEQTKYCALTAHVQSIVMMVINDKCWKSLTAKQKKILTDAANKSEEMGFQDVKAEEKESYNKLTKAGMIFTKPDLAPFREKVKAAVWPRFGDNALLKKIQAIK
jgi:tripartite ATP-independent transporter DctP family solute receptor